MTKATIRYDGEHYRVYHNGKRLSGQYSRDAAIAKREAINRVRNADEMYRQQAIEQGYGGPDT